jgi:DNA-binding response OmpR family regulator
VKILVAEDDPASLLLLKTQLRKAGHEVTPTRNGQEAWSALEKEDHPVLVSDCMMPEMDGFELCRRVRTRTAGAYTYVIVLTSHEGQEEYRKVMAAGADDFLGKPVDPDQLLARLRVAERIVGLEREVARLRARLKGTAD